MTKQETIQVLQSIENRAIDFPEMTGCDWVAIAAAKRHLQEEPVSEDLEEAMQHNAPNNIGIDDLLYWRNGFIAGAKWQNEKNKQWLADNHKHIFNNGFEEGFKAGRNDMEEQLKKDAITGEWFRCAVVLPSEYNADDVKIVKITIW